MGHPDGAHTHGSGGGIGDLLLVILAAVVVVRVAVPVLAAVAELVHMLLIVAAVIVGAGAAGLVGLLVWRLRRTRMGAARTMPPLPSKVARAAQPLPQARPAIERPAVHLHFHGIAPEDVAAILARHQDGPRSPTV
jgi:hypothetical protein